MRDALSLAVVDARFAPVVAHGRLLRWRHTSILPYRRWALGEFGSGALDVPLPQLPGDVAAVAACRAGRIVEVVAEGVVDATQHTLLVPVAVLLAALVVGGHGAIIDGGLPPVKRRVIVVASHQTRETEVKTTIAATIWAAPKKTCPAHGTETASIEMECRAGAQYRIFVDEGVPMGDAYDCSAAACNDANRLQELDDDNILWVEEI
jgi:hypothetical protein